MRGTGRCRSSSRTVRIRKKLSPSLAPASPRNASTVKSAVINCIGFDIAIASVQRTIRLNAEHHERASFSRLHALGDGIGKDGRVGDNVIGRCK